MITQHYDTLQSMGENTNSNLILLPNAPTAASDMLSQMVTSFVAANRMGETMKSQDEEKIKLQKLELPKK